MLKTNFFYLLLTYSVQSNEKRIFGVGFISWSKQLVELQEALNSGICMTVARQIVCGAC